VRPHTTHVKSTDGFGRFFDEELSVKGDVRFGADAKSRGWTKIILGDFCVLPFRDVEA
jgi:hypothetical protein